MAVQEESSTDARMTSPTCTLLEGDGRLTARSQWEETREDGKLCLLFSKTAPRRSVEVFSVLRISAPHLMYTFKDTFERIQVLPLSNEARNEPYTEILHWILGVQGLTRLKGDFTLANCSYEIRASSKDFGKQTDLRYRYSRRIISPQKG